MEFLDVYDKEYISLITDIENLSHSLDKYARLRVESWCRKFSQVTNNKEWKKNRNLHAISLLDMLINNRFEEPYNKFPPDGPLPILSKSLVKSKLTKKFWQYTKHIYDNVAMVSPHNSNEVENEEQIQNYTNNKNKKRPKTLSNTHLNLNTVRINKGIDFTFGKSNNLNDKINNIVSNARNEKNIEVDILKDAIIKLEDDLNKKDAIIAEQRKEKIKLTQRIEELERMLASFLSMEKL